MRRQLFFALTTFVGGVSQGASFVDVTLPPPLIRKVLEEKAEANLHDVVLTSIMLGKNQGRIAIINKKPVKEGQYINGYHVTSIKKTHVIITSPDKKIYTIRIIKRNIKSN